MKLTPRQTEVLELLAEHGNSQGVAEALHISQRTARNHTFAICRRLGVNNMTRAVVVAHQAGLIDINQKANQ